MNRLLFGLGLLLSLACHSQTCLAQKRPVTLPYYANMEGTSGAITTPNAFTLPRGSGFLVVQESFALDSLDRVHLTMGITDRLEVGLRSDIPALSKPQLSFIVKFTALMQDSLFHGMPSVGIGMNRGYMYFVSSYKWDRLSISGGWNKTKNLRGFFANASVQILPAWTLQADISPVGSGIALRGRWRCLWASIIYHQPRYENKPLEDYFWEVGYSWDDSPFDFIDPPHWGRR